MENGNELEKPENLERKRFTSSDVWLFFPEGIIGILFLLACPIQAVILFMHNRVASGIFLMACAATCIYSSSKLMQKNKTYLAFCALYVYTVISFLIGMS